MRDTPYSPFDGMQLDKLGQIGTAAVSNKSQKPAIIVSGQGSDIKTKEKVEAWNRRKLISQKIVFGLIKIAQRKKRPDREKEYWRAYHCLNKIHCSDNKLYGKYCKTRICSLCSGNRKAEIINKYKPIIEKWPAPQFLTLTIQSVPAHKVAALMRNINKGLNKILSKYKKRAQRDKGKRLIGIRSLECNFNPISRTYNPHFHLILPDKETSDILKREWLILANKKKKEKPYASHWCQVNVPISNVEGTLVEIIKYGSKIFTDPLMKKKKGDGKKITHYVYIAALHNILTAMQGLRLFNSFGFRLPKDAPKRERKSQLLTEYDELIYDPHIFNWVDTESDLTLTDYIIPDELKDLLNNRLDTFWE